MKKCLIVVFLMTFLVATTTPAFAIKQLSDQFKAKYVTDKATPGFKAAIDEAKCNVCHQGSNKKMRNPFGKSLHEALKKDKFPIADLKKAKTPEELAKFADRLNDLFKKIEDEKSGDSEKRTFAERMKADLSPGGDKDGK
jgi:cytochrome c peroxidase